MRPHAALTLAYSDKGGVSSGDHVADSIGDAIIWVGDDIIKELVNGHSGVFSGKNLSDADGADVNHELVVHDTCITEEGTNNALDTLDISSVEWRTDVGFVGILNFGAV